MLKAKVRIIELPEERKESAGGPGGHSHGGGQCIGRPLHYFWAYVRSRFTRAAASRNTSWSLGPEDASRLM